MPTLYVARSVALTKWASDVGLSKHVYKVGLVEGERSAIELGWAGFEDWKLVKSVGAAADLEEQDAIERLSAKVKMLDPKLYPRIRGTLGIFKVTPTQVENFLTLTNALAGIHQEIEANLKPADFATYLLHAATRQGVL